MVCFVVQAPRRARCSHLRRTYDYSAFKDFIMQLKVIMLHYKCRFVVQALTPISSSIVPSSQSITGTYFGLVPQSRMTSKMLRFSVQLSTTLDVFRVWHFFQISVYLEFWTRFSIFALIGPRRVYDWIFLGFTRSRAIECGLGFEFI